MNFGKVDRRIMRLQHCENVGRVIDISLRKHYGKEEGSPRRPLMPT